MSSRKAAAWMGLAPFLLALALLPLSPKESLAWEDSSWWDGFVPPGVRGGGPSTGGDINVIYRQGNQLYVGGDFDTAGGVPANNIARWDGERWHALDEGVDGIVHSICSWDGSLYVGGDFQNPHPYIARWLNDDWGPAGDQEFDDIVRTMVSFHDELWVAGDVMNVGDLEVWRAASFDGLDWHTRGGFTGENWWESVSVKVLHVYADTLRAGGDFERVNDRDIPYFAKFDEGTDSWLAHGTGEGLDWDVNCLVQRNADLWIGGEFGSVDGEDCTGLAWLGSGGFLHTPIGGGADHSVTALEVHNGWLHAATRYGIRPYGSWLDEDPHWLDPLGDLSDISDKIYDMESYLGDLYAAGSIRDGIARWDGEGWRRLGLAIISEGSSHSVQALCPWEDGIAAAGFMQVSSADPTVYSACVAYFDGETWLPLAMGLNDDVRDLIVHDGDLYACGDFDNNYTDPMPGIARWDGSAWQPLGDGLSGVNGAGYAMARYQGGLAVGGSFTAADGVPIPSRVALWDGGSFSPLGSEMTGPVDALAIWNGALVAGGVFDIDDSYHYVVRLDGDSWVPMDEGLDDRVHALALRHGDLHAGGRFSVGEGETTWGLARWNGSAWLPVGDGVSGVDYPKVHALHETPAGLLVGGEFTEAGGEPAGSIALWTGAAWRYLGSGLSGGWSDPKVLAFCDRDGELYIGGNFDQAGGKLSCGIARWQGDITPVALESMTLTRQGHGVEIRWSTADDVAYEFRLEGAVDSTNWYTLDVIREAPGRYLAHDDFPHLAAGGHVEYRLRGRQGQESWQVLRVAAIDLPGQALAMPELSIHPNPGNPSFRLSMDLPLTGPARLSVHDIQGRRLALLLEGEQAAAALQVDWDGRDDRGHELSAGVYLIRLATPAGKVTRKAVLLR